MKHGGGGNTQENTKQNQQQQGNSKLLDSTVKYKYMARIKDCQVFFCFFKKVISLFKKANFQLHFVFDDTHLKFNSPFF